MAPTITPPSSSSNTIGNNSQLATLLFQAAAQLATGDQHPIHRSPRDCPPSNFLHPEPTTTQQEDQLSDASAPTGPRTTLTQPLLLASLPTSTAAAPLPVQLGLQWPPSAPPITSSQVNPQQLSPDVPQLLLDATLPPPVPARIRARIISGEYIDFNTLLTFATLSGRDVVQSPEHQTLMVQMSTDGGQLHLAPSSQATHRVSSFASWMEAWNIYATKLLSAKPQHALELFGYQCIITSANLRTPLTSWMTYNIKFRTLAATYPSLRWDTRPSDLWMECITMPRLSPDRWPCLHCNSTNHFLECCLFRPGTLRTQRAGSTPTAGSQSHHATELPSPGQLTTH